jgi:hypothetical protein
VKEVSGNIWYYHNQGYWIVVPTNGYIKNDGNAVMGRGLALEASQRFPELRSLLGQMIASSGNVVQFIHNLRICVFPVKHNWWELADIALIEKNAATISTKLHLIKPEVKVPIYLPRVGCGNGKLQWSIVKPILEKYLDDRFVICDRRNVDEL